MYLFDAIRLSYMSHHGALPVGGKCCVILFVILVPLLQSTNFGVLIDHGLHEEDFSPGKV